MGNKMPMHRYLLPFALLGLSLSVSPVASAQSDSLKMHTLFGSGHDRANGGWGAPSAHYTRIMDQDAMLVGVRGGWLIDHSVTLGIATFGLVTNVPNAAYDEHLLERGVPLYSTSQFRMGYGGLLIEPIIAHRSAVHVTLPIIIGAGGCVYQIYSGWPGPHGHPDQWDTGDSQAFFVFEPGVELELSLIRLVRVGLGVSYRYTSDLDMPSTPKDALRGMNAGVTIKIGSF